MLVPFYLMCSYLYYKKDTSLITDDEFDNICKDLLKNWDNINHVHKHLISKESLKAGTGYDLKYTSMIISAANSLLNYKNKDKLI
jgi:NAD-dependent DNA ligase